jgi:hypothetical protein
MDRISRSRWQIRERELRMVLDHIAEHESKRAAVWSIGEKRGRAAQALHK